MGPFRISVNSKNSIAWECIPPLLSTHEWQTKIAKEFAFFISALGLYCQLNNQPLHIVRLSTNANLLQSRYLNSKDKSEILDNKDKFYLGIKYQKD